jgi:surfeit locus 1 family protein
VDHVPPQPEHDADERRGDGKPPLRRLLFLGLSLLGVIGFTALGVWQTERRAWKLALIARVDARIHAPAAPLPGSRQWPGLDAHAEEYRRVRTSGEFLNDRETLTQALTEQGAGFWVMTPLRTPQGMVLVNRGFVPDDRRDPAARRAGQPQGPVTITGLLRATEPKGGFLRTNDPQAGRWYSRDVDAIARAHHLGPVAPFFIDADATPNPGGYPIGGLTVVHFRNAHLVYALTWFGLAVLSLTAAVRLLRSPEPR